MTARPRLSLTAAVAGSALALAGVAALVVAVTAADHRWSVSRLAVLAVLVLAAGIAVGSDRLIGLSTAPVLAALIWGATGSERTAWGTALLVGCAWYVALEAGWASVELRTGTRASPAVGHRWGLEVATVVAVGAGFGLIGLGAASIAPERTLVVRVVLLAAIVGLLAVAVRRLAGPRLAAER